MYTNLKTVRTGDIVINLELDRRDAIVLRSSSFLVYKRPSWFFSDEGILKIRDLISVKIDKQLEQDP